MKARKILTASLIAVTSLVAADVSPEKIKEIQDRFPTIFQDDNIKMIKSLDRGKYQQFQMEAMTNVGPQRFDMFAVDGLDVILAGNAYDKDGKRVTIPVDPKLVKEAVALTFGSGNEPVYIVTDPECPYCQQLEKSISKSALEKYSINVVFMPLSFHQNAIPMIEWMYDAKDDKEFKDRYEKVMSGDDSYKKDKVSNEAREKAKTYIMRGYGLAQELGVQGTPSVFDKDLNPINPAILAN